MKWTRIAPVVAGVLLLVLIGLVGCGGGSSDSESGGGSGSTSASAGSAGSAAPGGEDGVGGGSGGVAGQSGSEGGINGVGGSSGGGSGGKHGPHVPQPKGAPEPHITPEQREEATVANMTLRSPNSVAGGGRLETLPALYTCDGKNMSPALRWNGIPSGTQELALFAMNVQPVEGKLFVDWAVAGLSPDLTEIEAGKLPKGAIVGVNSFGKTGYGLCPSASGEIYMFALYALPKKLSPQPGFDPHDLRKEVLDASGNVGLLPLTYARG